MSKFCGKDFLIQIGDGADPEVFSSITAIRDTGMTINGEQVDITDKGSSGWRELLEGCGINSMSLSGSGVFSDNANVAILQGRMIDNLHISCRIISGNGDIFQGTFELSSFERNGTYNDSEQYSMSLESASVVTYTAPP